MKDNLKYFLLLSFFSLSISLYAQTKQNTTGYSDYVKYDKSFISNNTRAKHSLSLGISNSYNSPFNDQSIPSNGLHVGYNYLIIKRYGKYIQELDKVKTKNVIKHAFGVHIDAFYKNETLINVRYYRSMLLLNLGLFEIHLFNEYGLGIHKLPDDLNQKGKTALNFSFEVIRLKFFNAPLFIHGTLNYDLSNKFLVPERKNLQTTFGLRYYFYKNKYRE